MYIYNYTNMNDLEGRYNTTINTLKFKFKSFMTWVPYDERQIIVF